ncbi:Protein of unknown function [Pyronema omphalodes CBS 100304]|uniref:Uncharacterized protein n=1 Tax=Pyronema omphalodes (strain CBS 100304) TaxID=1076935 RepID=U4LJI4_PYROM|nr:Protein of unknown function [Pyronema omphalodes CBS 100304]
MGTSSLLRAGSAVFVASTPVKPDGLVFLEGCAGLDFSRVVSGLKPWCLVGLLFLCDDLGLPFGRLPLWETHLKDAENFPRFGEDEYSPCR